MKKAADVMIPLDQYPHVLYHASILEAMKKMAATRFEVHGQKSLPRVVLVFNEKEELLGTVRRRDFFRALEPEKLVNMLPGRYKKPSGRHAKATPHAGSDEEESKAAYDRLIREAQARSARPVTDVMSPIHIVVDYDDDIFSVILKIIENDLSLVPVLKDNRVVGVVRTVELLYEMCDMLHF